MDLVSLSKVDGIIFLFGGWDVVVGLKRCCVPGTPMIIFLYSVIGAE